MADSGVVLEISKSAANILNKQPRTVATGSQEVAGKGVARLFLSKYHITPFTALCQHEYGGVKPMPPSMG